MPTTSRTSAAQFNQASRRLDERLKLLPSKLSDRGDDGAHVGLLQRALKKVGAYEGTPSGSFDAKTRSALKAFQKAQKLPVTGDYDTKTRASLRQELTRDVRRSSPKLELGSTGSAVLKTEQALKKAGLLEGKADDVFDAKTQAAVNQLKKAEGMKADGEVGIGVWRKVMQLGGATGKTGTFTTVSLNIKNNPPMSHARLTHDVRKAAAAADVIGWNEIAPKSYFAAIKALGKDWDHYMPKPGLVQVPISWKKSVFEKVDEGHIKTHGGLAKVSPNRYVTWVKLKHKETGETIVRMNTHTVAGAWSPKKQSHREWRRDSWNTHMEKLSNLVEKFEKQGDTVIIGGDFNRNHYPVLGKKVQYDNSLKVGTHGGSTLDYVMHVPDESIKTVKGGVLKGFNSDHDAVVVKYKLTGK